MKKILSLTLSAFVSLSLVQAETTKLSVKNPDAFAGLFDNAGIKSDSSPDNIVMLDEPIEIKARVSGVGRFKTRLSRQKFFGNQDSGIALLQGSVTTLSGSSRARSAGYASLIRKDNGKYTLRLFSGNKARFSGKNAWSGILEINADLELNGGKLITKKIALNKSSKKSSEKFKCLTGKNKPASTSVADGSAGTKAAVKIIQLLVEADEEYANEVNIGTELPTILNGMDTHYQRDLALSVVADLPTSPVVYTQPVLSEPNQYDVYLMSEMKQKHPGDSRTEDVHFLFTGKQGSGDLDGLAGLAGDIGAVCSKPNDSVTFTIRYDTNEDIITGTHEVGHLVGGEHDDDFTTPAKPGIMNSGTGEITGKITKFSNYSINQITSYINSNSSCLDDGEGSGGGGSGPSTLPATAVFDAYKDGKFFAVELYDENDDSGFADYTVSVLYKKKSSDAYSTLRNITTDEDGYARFRPKKTGTYAFQVEDLISRKLKYRK